MANGTASQTTLSFRGRERSDRRFAPSECERSPESITTGRAVVMKVVTLRWHTLLLGVMDSGLAGKSAQPIFLRPGMTA